MEQITTARQRKSAAAQLEEGCRNNRPVTLSGMVHTLRAMGGVTFLVLRTGEEIVQCVCGRDTGSLCRECAVRVTGSARREERAPGGIELADAQVQCLSRPAAALPAPVFKQSLHLNLDTQLGLRPVALRSLRERSVFRIQAAVSQAFRDYLQSQGFVEIHTPKIVHAGAEGAPTSSGWTISGAKPVWPSPLNFTSRPWWGFSSGSLKSPRCSGRKSIPPPGT